ncbi:MAG: hypothetical protein COV76_02705 [Candidatus Omnitrophica bacterium CG11_big_fil_rev_8_21_14_0_20_64_10]|nr:MAG: hypothetical protein COV76_02705 [Candidatus Omnitrophica bacterium CG11_big_fil_rev_8_21_14_0_20_64_10]
METHGRFYAGKLMDLANLAAATLVFGQMLTGKIIWPPLWIGGVFFFMCVVISYWLRQGDR